MERPGLSRRIFAPPPLLYPGAAPRVDRHGGLGARPRDHEHGYGPLGRRSRSAATGRAARDLPEPLGPGAAGSAAPGAVRRRPGRPPDLAGPHRALAPARAA